MKNAILNAPKTSAKNGIKLVKGKNGMALVTTKNVANVPENATGEKIKKAKKLGEISLAKIEANAIEKAKRKSMTYNLNALKGNAEKYATLLGQKYDLNISIEELCEALKSPKVFLAFLSEKQKANFEAKKLSFSYWLILGLVAKYFKSKKA
jgi:hypothetical protein